MNYNEAVVTARDKAMETLRSWHIFFDGKEEYQVREASTAKTEAQISMGGDYRLKAVVHPVWTD